MSVTIFWCEWEEKKTESHELLQLALEQYLEQSPLMRIEGQSKKKKAFVANAEKGKPYFVDFLQVKFSISHSENLWACAFGDTEVGLDLQSEYRKDGERIARRFFHPDEIEWMEKNGFGQFSRIWTHKESYVKFTGVGLTEGMDYFSVVPWLQEEGTKTRICQQEILFREGYWMVLTSSEPQEIALVCLNGFGKEV